MKCCFDCFNSKYLQEIIHSNSEEKGNCDYCLTQNISLYNPKELILFLAPLIEFYTIDKINGQPLVKKIKTDFGNKIFSEKVEEKIDQLLVDILEEEFSREWILESKVSLSFLKNSNEKIIPLQDSWGKFAEEIRYSNRFHIQNTLDLNLFKKIIEFYVKPIKKGKIFYRSRISDRNGFNIRDMGNPPTKKAKAGRANPTGISYLYLSDNIQTTLYETRAALFDFVTIGEFRLNEDIKVINLRGDTYDPIFLAEQGTLDDFMILLPFASRLESELAKPRRRIDSELDYLPTQYLSEFIKSQGYSGVEFKSSLHKGGYNLAIFEPQKFEGIKREIKEIIDIEISFIEA